MIIEFLLLNSVYVFSNCTCSNGQLSHASGGFMMQSGRVHSSQHD